MPRTKNEEPLAYIGFAVSIIILAGVLSVDIPLQFEGYAHFYNEGKGSAPLYWYAGRMEAYRSAPVWSAQVEYYRNILMYQPFGLIFLELAFTGGVVWATWRTLVKDEQPAVYFRCIPLPIIVTWLGYALLLGVSDAIRMTFY